MNDFLNWELIGKGTERQCFLFPQNKQRCLKVSSISKSKQSKREIKYLSYLKKKNVPFLHIPELYSVFKNEYYLGVEQEVVRDSTGLVSNNLEKHMKVYCIGNKQNQERLLATLNDLYVFMLKYNIVPCDLVLSNILIKVEDDLWKAYIIDGLGTTEFIPFTNYIDFLGRVKIKRKWKVFIDKVRPLVFQ